MLRRLSLCAAAAALSACSSTAGPAAPASSGAAAPGVCAMLSVNDTYRIEVSPDGTGGMSRVRTLRRDLEKQYPDLLMFHAGDFLYPSLLSRQYQGAQMIDAFNHLDGSDAFDPRLFVTFGNHEFEDERGTALSARLGEASFRWVSSNIEFVKPPEGLPAGAQAKIAEDAMIACGGYRVGVFGLTTDEKSAPYIARFLDPVETARTRSKALRARGADIVVGLTHESVDEDEHVLRTLGKEGPDLIIGGHEHARQRRLVGGGGVYKADADAHTANLLKVTLDASGVHVDHTWLDVGPAEAAEDPEMKALVDGWLQKHEKTYCETVMKLPMGCLEERLTVAGAVLVAGELSIRRFETNLGDYVADLALDALAKDGAQVAFLNAGTLRLNYDIAKGSVLTRRNVEELFAYPAPLRLIEITGATLQKIVDHAVSTWTGVGHWLQVAGFAFRHDPKAKKATDLTLLGASPHRVVSTEKIRAVVNSFLVDPTKGQDGYTMIGPADIVDKLGPDLTVGPDLKQIVTDALRRAGDRGVAPPVHGHICNTQVQGPCLVK